MQNRTHLKEIIRNAAGEPIRYSRNLAGILRHAGGRNPPLIKLITADPFNQNTSCGYAHANGKLCVLFENGDSYETNFASFECLQNWLRNRRNWYGAPLRVAGQDAGKLSYKNPHLIQPLTDVVFRVLYPAETNNQSTPEIIALFPALPGTNNPYTCQSYMHVGQHSAADPFGVITDSKAATPEQYAALYKELTEQVGYRLRIVKRLGSHYLEQRRAALKSI